MFSQPKPSIKALDKKTAKKFRAKFLRKKPAREQGRRTANQMRPCSRAGFLLPQLDAK
jgi:hypothetical protein